MSKLKRKITVLFAVCTLLVTSSCSKEDAPDSLFGTTWVHSQAWLDGTLACESSSMLQFLSNNTGKEVFLYYENGSMAQDPIITPFSYSYDKPKGTITEGNASITFTIDGNVMTMYSYDGQKMDYILQK